MSFTFFTLGGMQLWEDVYFYQKWRIQRSCLTGNCRLLDNWDIRRASGNFEQCRKEFEKYREIYQLGAPRSHAVLMLHGLGRSKNMFSRMAQQIEAAGFEPVAINFPSTRKDLKSHLRQLDFLLGNLEGIKEISFIGHGIGGIILRGLLNSNAQWQQKLSIGRSVQINPPNRGNRLAEKILQYRIGKWLLGPAARQCESANMAKMPGFPKDREFAVLTTENPRLARLADYLPHSWQKALPRKVDSILLGAQENQNIKINNFNAAANPKIIHACINFIKSGKLGKL